jgi:hypothetical protein
MSPTPQESRDAVLRVLREVDKEHEAAYTVISEAVRRCISSGMGRKETAQFLGLSPWRIDSQGRYFRSLRATRNLFRSAFGAPQTNSCTELDVIVCRAWDAEERGQSLNHI